MDRIAALALAALIALAPAAAQQGEDAPGSGSDMDEAVDLLGEGLRQFFEGLSQELEPALRDLAREMQPALQGLMDLMDEADAYEMPERLPNGDIIIRRKRPPDGAPAPGPAPEDEIEL